jgi:hypothetical protein
MLEKLTPVFRIASIALAGFIVLQGARAVAKKNPLASIKLPKIELPAVKVEAKSDDKKAGATAAAAPDHAANPAAGPQAGPGAPHPPAAATGGPVVSMASGGGPPVMMSMPNGMPPGMPPGARMTGSRPMPPGMPPRGMPMMMGGMGAPGLPPNTPPEIKDRLDKIYQSQILGMIIRPMPMALQGIAGKEVFIRTATGQSGMASEGSEFGGVKILKVGTNRVLVEVDGKEQELTLFQGLGSDSLLSKGKENQK